MNEDIAEQHGVIFDSRQLVAAQPLIHQRKHRFDEHRSRDVRIDFTEQAEAHCLADDAGSRLDETPVTIALVTTALHAYHFAFINQHAKEVPMFIEVLQVGERESAQAAIRCAIAVEDLLDGFHHRRERR